MNKAQTVLTMFFLYNSKNAGIYRKSFKTTSNNFNNSLHVFFGILDVTWQA